MLSRLRRVIAQALTPPAKPLPYPTDEMLADALGCLRVETVKSDTIPVRQHTRKKPLNVKREQIHSALRASLSERACS